MAESLPFFAGPTIGLELESGSRATPDRQAYSKARGCDQKVSLFHGLSSLWFPQFRVDVQNAPAEYAQGIVPTSTAELMLEFHRRLKSQVAKPSSGFRAARALREAALKLQRLSAYRYPFYWAGFVATGKEF